MLERKTPPMATSSVCLYKFCRWFQKWTCLVQACWSYLWIVGFYLGGGRDVFVHFFVNIYYCFYTYVHTYMCVFPCVVCVLIAVWRTNTTILFILKLNTVSFSFQVSGIRYLQNSRPDIFIAILVERCFLGRNTEESFLLLLLFRNWYIVNISSQFNAFSSA